MPTNKIKNKNTKNKTQKSKMIKSSINKEKTDLHKNNKNNYDTFEDKIEEAFKKNGIDIVSTSYNLEKQILSNLKKAVSPYNIKPNQDFYSYINDRWLSEISLSEDQKYITQVDDFRITQHKVYKDLIEIIEKFISNPSTKNSKKAKCIKNAYKSFLTFNTIEQTRETASRLLKFIDNLFLDPNNIWELLSLMNSSEIISWGSPFVWALKPDEKNPKIFKCYLDPPKLTLIDVEIYFDSDDDTPKDKKYKSNYRKTFFKYLNKLFTIALGNNHGFNVKDVFYTEIEIVNAMVCNAFKVTDSDNYNLVTKEESLKYFGFDWEKFCHHMGFKNIPNEFITSNVNYLLCGTKLLKEKWNTPQWKTYFIYIYIRQQCRWNIEGWTKTEFPF